MERDKVALARRSELQEMVDAVHSLSDDPSPANVERYLASSRALEGSRKQSAERNGAPCSKHPRSCIQLRPRPSEVAKGMPRRAMESALLRFANGRGLDLSEARVTARVGIGLLKTGGLGLAVALDLDAPALSRDVAVDLMNRAHETCPYSRATRGNIVVTLTVSGSSLERQAA